MRINTNVSSLNAWRNLTVTDGAMGKNLERLSSGYRINRAGDDVAGLAISENMRAQVKGLNQAVKNAQDGISLLQTAEGSLNEVHTMLHRMRELAVQSANGTLQPEDRKQIQTEMDNLAKEVTRITNATQFNSKDLIDGSLTTAGVRDVTLQIGPNGGQTVSFEVGAMDSKSLGISRDVMTAKVFTDTATTNESVNGGSFINSVDDTGKVGAGMNAGEYYVKFDANNKTVQLFSDSALTKSIGTAVKVLDSSGNVISPTVKIGDDNTAQTVELNLKDKAAFALLTADTVDHLQVGARVGAVTDAAAAQLIMDTTTAGTGVVNIGWGMKSASYDIEVVDTDPTAATAEGIVLKDASGTIGAAKTFAVANAEMTAKGYVELGDKATGRTIQIKIKNLTAAGAPVGTKDTISVTNNNQAGESAKFDGGVKYANSQAFAGLNVSSVDGAQAAIAAIDKAIGSVSYQRSQLGAITNRLEHTISNLEVVSENLTASESRIRDVDMALEMTKFTKQQILMQSGTAMLAQANQKNQAVLSLLR